MKQNLKKMISYYKPYRGTFYLDMFFALLASLISLVIPLVVRYVTTDVVKMETQKAVRMIVIICGILAVLVLVQFAANYFITNIGHVMGAKMEYDMRAEIFNHYQKLSFSFFDDQKVGQLMSRITSDLFEITELLHHGPENLAISFIKIIGAFIILSSISGYLTMAAFILLPFMFIYAFFMNKRMKRAFRENRVQIAEVNTQIEDNLSGIRVVKAYVREDFEKQKFDAASDSMTLDFVRAEKIIALNNPLMNTMIHLSNILVLSIGSSIIFANSYPTTVIDESGKEVVNIVYNSLSRHPRADRSLAIVSSMPFTKLPLAGVLSDLASSTYSFIVTLSGIPGK